MNYLGTVEPIPVDEIWDVPCIRCGHPSQCQWAVCANDKRFLPLCIECDIALNRLVMMFLNFDDPDEFIADYRAKLISEGTLDGPDGEEIASASH